MTTNIPLSELQQRAGALTAALRALESERFQAGRRQLLGTSLLPALIVPGNDPTQPDEHMIFLGAQARVPVVVQRLACAVLDAASQCVAIARTDSQGVLCVALPRGEYSLQLVDDIREVRDVRVLAELGDALAREQLAAALTVAELPLSLRVAVQQAVEELAGDDELQVSARPRPLTLAERRAHWVVEQLGLSGTAAERALFPDVLVWDDPEGRYYAQLELPAVADLQGGQEVPLYFCHATGPKRNEPATEVAGRTMRWPVMEQTTPKWERTIPPRAQLALVVREVLEGLKSCEDAGLNLIVGDVMWPLRNP